MPRLSKADAEKKAKKESEEKDKKEKDQKQAKLLEGAEISQIYETLSKEFPSAPFVEKLSTGSLMLDDALHGGWPRGRIVEIFGQTGTGKSTVLLHGAQNMCMNGKKVVYLDPEWAVNDSLIQGVGLGPYYGKSFFLHKAQTFSEIDRLLEIYLQGSSPPDAVIVDSAQAMLPSKKVHGPVEGQDPGLQARYMTVFVQKYKAWVGHTNTFLGFINQVRNKFTQHGASWDVREEAAGGNALRFFSDIRLGLSVKTAILEDPEDKDSIVGNDVLVRTYKNKVNPMRHCLIPVIFGKGVSNIRSMTVYLDEVAKVVERSGAWYILKFGNVEEKFHGKEALSKWVGEHYEETVAYLKAKEILH